MNRMRALISVLTLAMLLLGSRTERGSPDAGSHACLRLGLHSR